jgi:hypothetical protein
MADDKKKKLPSFTTPRLRLAWPKLTAPDYGTKEYPKPDGEYSTKAVGRLDDPEVKKLIAALQPAYAEAMKEAQEAFAALKPETRKKLKAVTENPLYTELLDKETEEPTGEVEFKFAKRASFEAKKGPKAGQKVHIKVPLFDARGVAITKAPEIWGGTVARVSFTASPYFIPGTGAAGLKLNLDAVQIIELRQSGGRDATGYGFGQEEDGYAHSDAQDGGAESAQDGDTDQEQASGGTPDF